MNEPTSTDKVQSSLAFLRDSILDSHERKLLELVEQGWEAFYREIFGDGFVDIFDSLETADRHHSEAVEWHWEARLALLRGERPPDGYFAYFPTWSRANMKTSVGRAMLITDAMLTFAHGERGYALIPGGTNAKIKGTAMSIEKMLHGSAIAKWCPALSKVERNVYGRSRGWTADFISTQAGYVFHFIGLDEGVAGANVDNVRPTFIMPDDIDTRDQSPVIADTRFRVFTTEVLPTKQANTLIYWAQNIINRFSVRYRVEKQHVAILTNRKPTQPIPAVRGLTTERRTVNGIVKDIAITGHPTWRGWTMERVQDEIDTYGLPAFLAECQHDVEASTKGLLLHNWRDDTHVISESEFESIFFTRQMPAHWQKEWVNDWARTKTRFHANIAFWRAVSPQNSKLPGFTFIFHPMSFPANSPPEDVAERLLTCLEPGPLGQERERVFKSWQDVRRDELTRADALRHASTDLQRITFERESIAEIFPKYVAEVIKKHRVLGGVNSHERDDIRLIYNKVYGLMCVGVNPRKYGGIEEINRAMAVDPYTDHPVRPGVKGYTRFLVVVPDWTDAPSFEDASPEQKLMLRFRRPATIVVGGQRREIVVYPPKLFTDSVSPEDLHDDELFRFQMVNWKTRPASLTVTGEIIDDPEKANDDFGNGLQMCFVNGPIKNTPLTIEEEIEMLIPETARVIEGMPMTRQKQQQIEAARHFATARLEEKYGEDLPDALEGDYDYSEDWY